MSDRMAGILGFSSVAAYLAGIPISFGYMVAVGLSPQLVALCCPFWPVILLGRIGYVAAGWFA